LLALEPTVTIFFHDSTIGLNEVVLNHVVRNLQSDFLVLLVVEFIKVDEPQQY